MTLSIEVKTRWPCPIVKSLVFAMILLGLMDTENAAKFIVRHGYKMFLVTKHRDGTHTKTRLKWHKAKLLA